MEEPAPFSECVRDKWRRNYRPKYSPEKVMKRIEECKSKHRPKLKAADWTNRYKFCDNFADYSKASRRQFPMLSDEELLEQTTNEHQSHSSIRRCWAPLPTPFHQPLEHIHVQNVPLAQFIQRFENIAPIYTSTNNVRPDAPPPKVPESSTVSPQLLAQVDFISAHSSMPCIIHGCADDWKARTEWTWKRLSEGGLRQGLMKCGEDDDGYSVKIKCKYFADYTYFTGIGVDGSSTLPDDMDMKAVQQFRDDSPLYVFDGGFADREESKCLSQHFSIPKYFPEDLFSLVGEKRRPPYRCVFLRFCECVCTDSLFSLLSDGSYWALNALEVRCTLIHLELALGTH